MSTFVKKILKRLPIEVYALVIFPLVALFLILTFTEIGPSKFIYLVESGRYDYYLLFSSPHILPAIVIVMLYGLLRSFFWIWKNWAESILVKPTTKESWLKNFRDVIYKHITSIFFIVFIISAASAALFGIQQYLGTFEPDRIENTSRMLMGWDRSIFGVYLPFWLQGHSWSTLADIIFLQAYMLLMPVLTVLIIGLLTLRHHVHIRAFILAFMLTPMIAFPFWSAFPAVTPNEMYRLNVFDSNVEDQTTQYATMQSKKIGFYTEELLTSVEGTQSIPEEGHYHVPTFPSMHVAWATIVVYLAFVIGWPLGVLSILWWMANAAGAIMSLQHYGVDIILGTIVGLIAIFATRFLLQFETKHLKINDSIFVALTTLRNDLQYIEKKLTVFLNRHKD